MTSPSSRELLCVDVRGMKAAIDGTARSRHQSTSEFVRAVLAAALALDSDRVPAAATVALPVHDDLVRVSLRMSRAEAATTRALAQAAGLPVGAYVAGVVAAIPVLAQGSDRRDHLGALVSSNAAMAALARQLGRLADLLGQGTAPAAQDYRDALDRTEGKVRDHLSLVGRVLENLRPRRKPGTAAGQEDRNRPRQ